MHFYRYLLSVTVAASAVVSTSRAAMISWGDTFPIIEAADISNPAGSVQVAALDFNTAVGFMAGGGDAMINGIEFTMSTATGTGFVTTTLNSGPAYTATFAPTVTDDIDLDNMLDSHSWLGGNPASATFTIMGLDVGGVYQVQLINVGDTRGCCATRTSEPDDGMGNFTTGVQLTRGDVESVIGTFIADSDTQLIQFRSLNNALGNNDPGLSGFVVMQIIPEPGVATLGLLGVAGLIRRRR